MPVPVIVTFVLVLAVVFGAYWLFVARQEVAEQTALKRRLRGGRSKDRTGAGVSAASLVRIDPPYSEIPAFDQVLKKLGFISRPAQLLIDRAGLQTSVGVLVGACAVAGLAVFSLVWYLTTSPWLAAPIAGFSAMVPTFVVRVIASQRLNKFEEQFPEAIDLLARALKAGHALTTGLSLVAEEMPAPVGTEFKLAYDRQNFGMALPDALRDLGRRVPLIDARFFVTAVLTQREVGGNLSEVLENLSVVIRERFRVKRQVRVITAHARVTGWVLAMMPIALGVILSIASPKTMSVLWTHPTGIKMVVGAATLQIIGTLIIRKLVQVEY